MPDLPSCDDLYSPTLDLASHQDRIVRALAEGMQRGENPEDVLNRVIQDPSLREEAKRFLDYADTIFSRTEEPKIRERYNLEIQRLRQGKQKEIQGLQRRREDAERRTREAQDQLGSYRSEIEKMMQECRAQLGRSIAGAKKPYEQEPGEQKRTRWYVKLYRALRRKFYSFRGYNEQEAAEELGRFVKEIGIPDIKKEGGKA